MTTSIVPLCDVRLTLAVFDTSNLGFFAYALHCSSIVGIVIWWGNFLPLRGEHLLPGLDDGLPDFLTNDQLDVYVLPDTIHSSLGGANKTLSVTSLILNLTTESIISFTAKPRSTGGQTVTIVFNTSIPENERELLEVTVCIPPKVDSTPFSI